MKTLLVALLVFVVGTGTAFAECAWVLWEKSISLNIPEKGLVEKNWSLQSALPTFDTCREAAKEKAQQQLLWLSKTPHIKTNEMKEFVGGFVVVKEFEVPKDSNIAWWVQCFPDTVDPRGPKGK